MARYKSMILDMINASREHLTAEQVYLKLKSMEPGVVQATVYNNLNRLCEEGKIIRLNMDGADRYDRKVRHDHLICRCCGGITDIVLPDLTAMIEEKAGAACESYDLRVTWVCPGCRDNVSA